MDEIRFDRLTRSLSTAGSRRRALAAVLGGSLGLLGWHADEDAVAHNAKEACKKKSGKAKKKCLKKAKKHNATHTVAAAPPPPASDPCAACTAGQICQAGACQTCDVCPSGCTFTSVQAAINAIGPQLTTIQVCSGTYHGDLNITRDLTLTGAGQGADPATNTILDGTGTTSVVKIGQLSIVSIQDMRITGGAGASFGGGIRNDRGRLTVTDCTVAGNTVTDNGAGIDTTSGMTTLNGCTITDNEAKFYGGGIGNSGTTTLNGCTVSGNRAIGAGGIFNFSGTVTLNSSAVTNNTPDNCAPPIPGCTG